MLQNICSFALPVMCIVEELRTLENQYFVSGNTWERTKARKK